MGNHSITMIIHSSGQLVTRRFVRSMFLNPQVDLGYGLVSGETDRTSERL